MLRKNSAEYIVCIKVGKMDGKIFRSNVDDSDMSAVDLYLKLDRFRSNILMGNRFIKGRLRTGLFRVWRFAGRLKRRGFQSKNRNP